MALFFKNTSLEYLAKTLLILCMSIQLILFIQGVHICRFTDLLQFIYKHITSTRVLSQSFSDTCKVNKNLNRWACRVPNEAKYVNPVPLSLRAHAVKKKMSFSPPSGMFFTFLCFWLVILLF